METLAIEGPTPLRGEIEVAGAKNSVSKLLTASMLTAEPCRFFSVPAIGDMEITKRICQALGAHCTEGAAKQLDVQTPRISVAAVPESLAVKNRLSVMMLAPLLHRHARRDARRRLLPRIRWPQGNRYSVSTPSHLIAITRL